MSRRAPRTLRVFLLASTVALSIALVAPTAQAEVAFTTPSAATLEGEGTGEDRFVADGVGIACDEATYRGESSGSARTLALEPEYAQCTTEALTGFPADFFQELCDFVLHDIEQARKGWRAAVDLSCAPHWIGVGWDIFETEGAYGNARPFCSMRVPEQTGVGTAEVRNLRGDKGIEVHWNLDSFRYTVGTRRGFSSSLVCGSILGRAQRSAYYRGTARVFAKSLAGARVPLSIRARAT